jgi:hypothetical protein
VSALATTSKVSSAGDVVRAALRVLVAAALVTDAVVHLRLAANYQLAAPGGIGQGNLFRIEAVVAIGVAIYVLIGRSRASFAVAFVVLSSALAAVVLYRYVDVPAIGPIPSMYEPIWFFQKSLSALAEGVGAVLAVAALTTTRR